VREKLLKNWDSQFTLIAHGEFKINKSKLQQHNAMVLTKIQVTCYLFRKKPTFLLKEPAMF
jgi:hypothetical protein